jgi:transposase
VVGLVGVDWADQKHAYCLHIPAQHKTLESQFEQTPEAIAAWVSLLRERCGPGLIAVAVEAARGPLIHALMVYEHLLLYPVNPKSLARFREALYPSGSKDDPPDAGLLLELLRCHRERLRVWRPEDVPTRKLALLVEHRRGFVDTRTGFLNQLASALKAYFPLILQLFGDALDSPMCLDFLKQWATLEALQKASPVALRKFFYGHNSRSADRLEERLGLIKNATPLTTDPAVIEGYAMTVQTLVAQLAALQPSIDRYDQAIADLFAAHAKAPLFEALPGAGAALAPRLLVAFGSRTDRFTRADDLACFSGTAPVTVRSGKTKRVHWRYARPKFLHQTFVEFCGHSLLHCPWARCYYDYHHDRGQRHWSIMRRLSIRWQRILWKSVQTGIPYDEAKYLAGLKMHGEKPYAKLDEYIQKVAGEQKHQNA